MRTTMPAHLHRAQNPRPEAMRPCLAWILAASIFTAGSLLAAAQQPASPSAATQITAHKPVHPHKQLSAAHPAAASSLQAPTPAAAPKPPDWPANDRPAEATVVWNSQGLRIDAANSSLGQILKDVATATGAKVEGFAQDQRIFGSYGPGKARDILVQLFEGSGYNLLLIGDQGEGTPRQIVLSAKPSGAAPPVVNDQSAANEENADAEDQPQPQPQPQPQQQPAMRNGFAPGAAPRTPQQIMQEMQQRQQQLLQSNNPQ